MGPPRSQRSQPAVGAGGPCRLGARDPEALFPDRSWNPLGPGFTGAVSSGDDARRGRAIEGQGAPEDTATSLDLERLQTAAKRLRGDLVATPVVGGLTLPGRGGGIAEKDIAAGNAAGHGFGGSKADPLPAGADRQPHGGVSDLRLKPECLQPTGSAFIRGALHWCGRQLGARRGVAVDGAKERRPALAALLRSARLHRIPMEVWGVDPGLILSGDPGMHLDIQHCSWKAVGSDAAALGVEARGREGWTVWPGWADPDAYLGLATLGLELGQQLPMDTGHVVVGALELRDPVAAGLECFRTAGDGAVRILCADPGGDSMARSGWGAGRGDPSGPSVGAMGSQGNRPDPIRVACIGAATGLSLATPEAAAVLSMALARMDATLVEGAAAVGVPAAICCVV